MALTRRGFLERLAATGGVAMTYEAMTALGLLAAPAPQAKFDLQGHGNGTRVAILGAGLAGLSAAYELGKIGYACQVLEARGRPGGRAHTIRRGTITEEDGSTQVCTFDEGQYFNPGAMRIPHHHQTTLGYCRELGVPIEAFINYCDSTYLYQQRAGRLSGERVRVREARTDLDGYVSELLAKAISEDQLNVPLSMADRDNLIDYLRRAGALNDKAEYRGSSRRGYQTPPGVGEDAGKPSDPLAFSDLLGSHDGFYLQEDYDYQNSMFQIVGGTDRLPAAFAARLKDKIIYHAPVHEIRQQETGVSVISMDTDGNLRKIDADYCICTLPLSVLSSVKADFSPEFKKAIASATYAAAGKIGLQFKRRFWEEDDTIYGGHSSTDQEIAQIVYPSSGFHGQKGVLIGYYIMGNGRPMGERNSVDRTEMALEQGGRIHPQYRAEFENAFSVAWHRVPWSRGSWSSFSADARRDSYPLLLKPDRRVHLAGDHLTNWNAWMQGALDSGRSVATQLHARAQQENRPHPTGA